MIAYPARIVVVHYLENLLDTVFSVDVGQSADEQRAFLARVATKPDARQRDGLKAELETALADATFDWDALLSAHEVGTDEGQSGRQFVIDAIWTPLFGSAAPIGDDANARKPSPPA